MDENIEEQLQELVAQQKLSEAIAVVEQQIMQNPVSDFSEAVGRSLLHLTSELVNYLDEFFAAAEKEINVQSLSAEMNGITINYDLWYVDFFAFDRNEGLDDTDWLAEYNYSVDSSLPITSLEDIQAVYKDYMDTGKWEDEARESAAHDCAALVLLRVQELFQAAKQVAAARKLKWADLPLYVTAHDFYYDLIYKA